MTLPPAPKKLEGTLFIEIMPQFLHEIYPDMLVHLGAIVLHKGKKSMYEPLTDSLRKIQWVKLVGLKAIKIENEIAGQMDSEHLVMDPLGQTAHSLCVTDCLIHTKSALDSMAVFLTNLLKLKATKGYRDFKKPIFRLQISKKEMKLGSQLVKYSRWFKEIQDIRDEWIHRSSIRSYLIQGKSTVGVLPIPKNVMLRFKEQQNLAINEENFISTKNFVEYHYQNLISLFNLIVRSAIEIERRNLKGTVSKPADAEKQMTVFPTKSLQDMKLKGIKAKITDDMTLW